ncbi:MAG: hypothetical protein KF712_06020 [Akkermansiaceae bacterium]|nr:hypothetical protein [Akkermansiaceae bacterium]
MRARYARLTGRKARWETKLWSRWRNLFCVTMMQESKRREGSRQIRHHEKKGFTPAHRLIGSGDLQGEERRKGFSRRAPGISG